MVYERGVHIVGRISLAQTMQIWENLGMHWSHHKKYSHRGKFRKFPPALNNQWENAERLRILSSWVYFSLKYSPLFALLLWRVGSLASRSIFFSFAEQESIMWDRDPVDKEAADRCFAFWWKLEADNNYCCVKVPSFAMATTSFFAV